MMKQMPRTFLLLLALLLAMSLGGTTLADEPTAAPSNALIVYFSRVGNSAFEENVDVVSSASLNTAEDGTLLGNMQVLTNMIAAHTGADVFEIQVTDLYPSAYRATTNQAKQEQNDNVRPALATQVENMADYDVIYLGYPNWWYVAPTIINTFLEQYDLNGKQVIPFATSGMSGMGYTNDELRSSCKGAILHEGKRFDAQTKADTLRVWAEQF